MKKNNKGFTLIEIIISITIFTTAIGIGYMIINKNTESVSASMISTEGQMSVNIVNKYLTKDLEKTQPNNIIKPTQIEISSGTYNYKLNTNEFIESNEKINYIRYDVNISNNRYDLTRNTFSSQSDMDNNISKSNIEIISNQPIDDINTPPFYIENDNNIYTVGMQYKEKSNKYYNFDVSYRYNQFVTSGGEVGDGTPENPLPPTEEPEIDEELQGSNGLNGFIRFGYNDKKAYTSIGSSKVQDKPNNEYARREINNDKGEYTIRGMLSFNNNNGHCETKIDSYPLYEQRDDFGKLQVNQINATILGDARLELVIKQKDGGNENLWPILHKVTLDKVGKYIFPINTNSKDILIEGKIIKTQGSTYGEAIITFGTKTN
ncbi:prepilin-type N-terminal cleavage/methylation domain-containing protein [Romboutsia sp.]|uniref:prepilin-type N-terminal cleavage/methylation domain-containing protein n=1 Tax=Romboutsia sp. TaxID=1965302 RepID=UPI003F363D3B